VFASDKDPSEHREQNFQVRGAVIDDDSSTRAMTVASIIPFLAVRFARHNENPIGKRIPFREDLHDDDTPGFLLCLAFGIVEHLPSAHPC
jgi:hypothetical protein